ncbi:hypothetical protein ABDK00_011505 [Niabella insulamsoli]|uniref:hypothetical protein n=1 Tax=Niabella insulamsoli TaxID=3144874 RepID=UPI0031FE2AFC
MTKTALLMLCAIVSFFSTNIFAQSAFSVGQYVVLAKPGSNSAAPNYTLYTTTTPANGTSFVSGTTVIFDANVNGIGLNPVDRKLYGAAYKDPGTPSVLADDVSLYRIGADGAYVNLGLLPVTGQGAMVMGAPAEFVNASAGTMGADGSYTYMTVAIKQSGVNKMISHQLYGTPLNLTSDDVRSFIATISNVATLSAAAGLPIAAAPSSYYELTTTDPKVIAGMDAFVEDINENFPNVNWSNGGIQDIDIDPASQQLYAYFNYQDPSPSGQSVDVVGFPVVIAAPVSGVAQMNSVGNTINQTPDQEVAGISFDLSGNLFALFTSGQYGQLNLTTGAVENIVTSNIPTAVYLNQNHLRGDFAKAVSATLPVTFSAVQATIEGDRLNVKWITTHERDNDHFEIQASADGKNFAAIGSVHSKATSSESNASLSYEFTSAWGGSVLGVFVLGCSLFSFKKKRRKISLLLTGIGLSVMVFSCSKSEQMPLPSASDVFIRIAQIDKDGNKTYSKIVKAIK